MGNHKLLAILILVVDMVSGFAFAEIPIIEIADTSTPIPGEPGIITSFGIPSSDRDNFSEFYLGSNQPNIYNDVFFTAQGSNGVSGVYGAYFPAPGITEIATIADTTMTAATGGKFASFSNTSSGQAEVGFIATDSNGVQSVYDFDGELHFIASSNTSPVAGTTFGNFQSISMISSGPEDYVGAGEIESASGIYRFTSSYDPTFTFIANYNTIPPGSSVPATSFGPVSYKAGVSASNIQGFQFPESALLATVGGVVSVYAYPALNNDGTVAKINAPLPNGTGIFTSFGNPVATATYIEFTADYSSSSGPQQGIFAYGPYLNRDDVAGLQEFLASGTIAPDSGGAHFASFLALGNNEPGYGPPFLPSEETEDIPFLAMLNNGVEGLYDTTGIGTSVKILDTGDTLDGKTVSSIELSPDSSGLVFTTFEVGFTDGSSGIYYFNTNILPEPASICLLGLLVPLMSRRRS